MEPSVNKSRRTAWLGLALVLALALTAWRAAETFTPAPAAGAPVGATPVEQRLTGLLETVIGAGQVQVHRSQRPDNSQAFLILINEAGDAMDPGDEVLAGLLSSATFIDPLAGDTITFDRIAFVQAGGSLASMVELLELLGLLAVCGLIAAGLATQKEAVMPKRDAARMGAPRPSSTASATAPPHSASLLSQRITEDPARAAEVIRRWLGTRAADS